MVLLGITGSGASGNTILGGDDAFESKPSPNSVTSECQKEMFEGQKLAVVDTPGVFDNVQTEEEMKTEVRTSISFAAPCGQIHREIHTMALFTRGDDLEHRNFHQGKSSSP